MSVQQQVHEEMSHFAQAKRNFPHRLFRMIFANTRQHVLGKRATMQLSFAETVAYATEYVRREYPDFEPVWA